MAWFRNHYRCDVCNCTWTDEWSSMSDDDCPCCSARSITPYESEDLTEVVEKRGDEFIVLRSPETAEHAPDYKEVASFPTLQEAEAFPKGPIRRGVIPLGRLS